jgi:hypothetical protein
MVYINRDLVKIGSPDLIDDETKVGNPAQPGRLDALGAHDDQGFMRTCITSNTNLPPPSSHAYRPSEATPRNVEQNIWLSLV